MQFNYEMPMYSLSCNRVDHQELNIKGLCLSGKCNKSSAYCNKCVFELHKDCHPNTIQIEKIPELLQPLLSIKFELIEVEQKIHEEMNKLNTEIKWILTAIYEYQETPNLSKLNEVGQFLRRNDQMRAQREIENLKNSINLMLVNMNEKCIPKINKLEAKQKTYHKSANCWFVEGFELQNSKHYEVAIYCYQQALQLDPNQSIAWIYQGVILNNMKQYEEAIECFRQAIQLNPESLFSWNNLGFALIAKNQQKDAIECFREAIKIIPQTASAWNDKGMHYIIYRNIRKQQIVMKWHSIKIQKYLCLGNALCNLDKFKAAIDCYQKAIKIDPKISILWNNKGFTLFQMKKYKEAIECFEKALELDPKNIFALNNKGDALIASEKFYDAIYCCQYVRQIVPNNIQAWKNEGDALFGLKRYLEAINCYDNALKIDPKYTKAWNNKGVILNYLQKYQQAIYCYQEVIKIDPNNAKAWYNIGDALNLLKKYNEAVKCYQQAIQIDPKHDLAIHYLKIAKSEAKI